MSNDVTVNCHTCGSSLNHGHESLPSGLGALFKALGVPVLEWSGKTGVRVLPYLARALRSLQNDLDYYRQEFDDHDGPSAWSRVDFALTFLTALRDGICQDPGATINVL